jgi:NAD(P)-dependent dehydrogenase (short-subunit alcohol dehydrogenase family)
VARADLTGRLCVVTGANRGIGRATAEGLARLGAGLVLICRRFEDGQTVAREIGRRGGPVPEVVEADLSSQAAIRGAAAEIQSRHPQVNVLINNAGIIPQHREVTVDGLELQFAVNHLAYFLLTNLLLPQLRAGAPARVVNVSSGAHEHARLDFDDLQSERRYEPQEVYSRTKLANILFTYELARRIEPREVTANCLTPGVVATRMLRDYLGQPAGGGSDSTFGASPEQGAETSIYLAASLEVAGVTGKYFYRKKPVRSSRESYDEAAARRLWDVSERLTGLST